MKKLLLFFCILGLGQSVIAQIEDVDPFQNIIPNPGFEVYGNPPLGWFYQGKHFSRVMKYWYSPTTASPDIFGRGIHIPNSWVDNGFGKITPHSGESFIGITCFGCENGKPHCREYVQIQLKEPLVPGQRYYFECWLARLPLALEINQLGIHLSEQSVKARSDVLLDVPPQVYSRDVLYINEKVWKRFSGHFVAESPADYLTIGNFNPDSLTLNIRRHERQYNYAYYYIDDVLLRKEEPIIEVPVPEDDLTKIPLEEGKLIELKDIYFDHDKAELLPRSFVELRKLLYIMRENPKMVIEVHGHTDSVGDYSYNMELSFERAQAVVEYLVNEGISSERLRFKGFGDTQPAEDNQTRYGRKHNRRVEFLILRK